MREFGIKLNGEEIVNSLSKYALENGGSIHPLIIPSGLTQGLGIMNPSIYNDNGKLLVILRNVNYTFYHSEKKLFQHHWGPLTYIHPENDIKLRTWNWYLELDDSLNITRYNKIDTSLFDTYEPLWEFVGLEDARIFRWDGRLFTCGVRRDTTTNGEGRMELCEIVVGEDNVKEITRFRIPPPKDLNSYCEKNWVPILDQPFHFVKWTNPTEIVKVNEEDKSCKTVFLGERVNIPTDQRGSSQVLSIDQFKVLLTHEVNLFKSEVGRKDAIYRHRFIVWDKEWNINAFTKSFSLMGADVEFAVGMCQYKNDILITFGFQDNAAYVLRIPNKTFLNFISNNLP